MNNFSVNENLILKEIDNKSVVVDINTAKYYTFNETGNFILKCLINGMNYEETKDKFLKEFDVEEDVFKLGYMDFLKTLSSKEIILREEVKDDGKVK
ncbi:MAG: PqqD family protein [Syntrophaceae bacterium]